MMHHTSQAELVRHVKEETTLLLWRFLAAIAVLAVVSTLVLLVMNSMATPRGEFTSTLSSPALRSYLVQVGAFAASVALASWLLSIAMRSWAKT